eukprot:TRINITY_DN1417_c0_g1_i4.p1 TRINITY_DN1417_c0_g1~~TRINITY_DN1417_c0_g1_i4.p1  ORF type:complete len:198 (-),score=11.48 TRINITY_DN1417_c0_g1_i4:285-878(-)
MVDEPVPVRSSTRISSTSFSYVNDSSFNIPPPRSSRRSHAASSSSARSMAARTNDFALIHLPGLLTGAPITRMINEGLGIGQRETSPMFNDGIENILQYLMEHDNNYRSPASREIVETLPYLKYQKEVNGNMEECTVCREEFKEAEEVREMPCKHIFHGECLLTWLREKNSCPTCRYELPTEDSDQYNWCVVLFSRE